MIMRRYRQVGDPVLASYNFDDVASGEGYVTYYLSKTAGGQYELKNFTTYGDPTKYQQQNEGIKNYDTSAFNTPRTLKGKAVFNLAFTSVDNHNFWLSLYKLVGGTTANFLVSGQIAITGASDQLLTQELTIPQTAIKVGDVIRASVEFGGGAAAKLYIDPTNSLTKGITKLNLPFRIDV